MTKYDMLYILAPEMDDEARESFYKTVFMNDDSEYAAKLRVEYYRTKFRSMGENVTIGKGVNIINPEFISVGNDVQICDGCTLVARGEKGITLGDNVRLQHRVYLDTERTEEGYINVGRGTYIGTGTTLFGHRGLEIGEDCLLAQGINLTPYSHIFDDPNDIIYHQGGHCEKVTIGKKATVKAKEMIHEKTKEAEWTAAGAAPREFHPGPC